jgi:hypothetical protein
MGYEPTGEESPFDEEGTLWTKGYELVCDKTGAVIRNDGSDNFFRGERGREEEVYRYQNSEKVKLIGGYTSSYEWGTDEESGKFIYDKEY